MTKSINDVTSVLTKTGITLTEGEGMIDFAVIHPAIYWKGVAVFVIGLLLLSGFAATLGYFLMLVGAIMLGLAFLTRRFLVLAATNKRIFVRSGILYADMVELRLGQVESVEVGATLIGQFFNYASVIVTGTGERRIMVPFVANAIQFRSKVNQILVNK